MPNTGGRYWAAVDDYQRDVDFRDSRTLAALAGEYAGLRARLEDRQTAVLAAIDERRAAGQPVSPAWLQESARYQDLIQDADTVLAGMTDRATRLMTATAADAVERAQAHAQAMTEASLQQTAGPKRRGEVSSIMGAWSDLPHEAVRAIIAGTTLGNGISRDVSPLYELFDSVKKTTMSDIRNTLIDGVVIGQNTKTIGRNLHNNLNTSLARAYTIARTENHRVLRETNRQIYERNNTLVPKWRWLCARQDRTCAVCWAMDGQEFKSSERMATHVNCRCTMIPVTPSWAELGFPDIPDLPKPMTGPEVFSTLSPAQQRAILGPGKYDLYHAGQIRLSDLVGYQVNPDWGANRYERNLATMRDLAERRKRDDSAYEQARAAREQLLATAAQYSAEIDSIQARIDALRERIAGMPSGPALGELVDEQTGLVYERGRLQARQLTATRALLQVPNPTSLNAHYDGLTGPGRRAAVERGVDRFCQYVSADALPPGTHVVITDAADNRYPGLETRSYYSNGTNTVSLSPNGNWVDRTTTEHELGHFFEDIVPGAGANARAFLERRTAGETARPMQDYNPAHNSWETTKPDEFLHYYIGGQYQGGATETSSMGIEQYINDPVGCARKDPDYFEFLYLQFRGVYVERKR